MSLYLGTSPIANTGYDKANINLSNLTNTGKNIANWSNNVTNCITEIPQDIKLELNNDGTLKLKSGSKVYISTNGTFNAVTISGDKTGAGGLWTAGHSRSLFVVVNADNNNIATIPVEQTYSQDTAPTTFLVNQYGGWFDTANNIVKYTEDGGTTWRVCSLPICIGRPGETNVGWNGYLDQVFNGFGYIGSTVFALPGVKGLIPNGRNADGTLKNTNMLLNKVCMLTLSGGWSSNNQQFTITEDGDIGTNVFTYNEYENYVMYQDEKQKGLIFAQGKITNTKIDNIYFKTAFHALDYNDSSTISGWSMPSDRYINLTLGASGATYTAPANGWFNALYHTTASSGTNSTLDLKNRTSNISCISKEYSSGSQVITALIPARKGDVIRLNYEGLSVTETDYFRFIYAEGESNV